MCTQGLVEDSVKMSAYRWRRLLKGFEKLSYLRFVLYVGDLLGDI